MVVIAECHIRIVDGCFCRSICADSEVLHIAGVMAFGILQAMFLVVWIEVAASGLEIWSIALRILVDMDRMLSRWQILEIEFDLHTLLAGSGQGRCANILALSILHLCGCTFPLSIGRIGGEQQQTTYQGSKQIFCPHSLSFSFFIRRSTPE